MKRFIEGADRSQVTLLPECLDDYIAEDNHVRVVDAFAPLVGILAAAVPIQLELNVGVLLELERDGSVVSTFPVEERITIERSIASQESYREAYQVLIAEYRRRVLPRIESEFLLKVPDLQP